ncbi:DUF6176 family protein [Haladaptatus salinisoli]|uniref:DUF6176 family protein n=1 Tax=Haladaptatus salinisoli TaxID=2884876 RepID=UPI001D0AF190
MESGRESRLRDWFDELRERESEVVETLRHEGVYTETAFVRSSGETTVPLRGSRESPKGRPSRRRGGVRDRRGAPRGSPRRSRRRLGRTGVPRPLREPVAAASVIAKTASRCPQPEFAANETRLSYRNANRIRR